MPTSKQHKNDPDPLRRATLDLGPPLGQAMVLEMDESGDPNFEAEPMRAGDDASMLGCFGCVVAAAEALYGLRNLEPECVTCFLGTVHSEVAGDVPGAYFSFSADDGESYFQAIVAPAEGADVAMIWMTVAEGDTAQ